MLLELAALRPYHFPPQPPMERRLGRMAPQSLVPRGAHRTNARRPTIDYGAAFICNPEPDPDNATNTSERMSHCSDRLTHCAE